METAMIPDPDDAVVLVLAVVAAVAVDVAADQFSMPFVHMRAIRWFD